MPLAALRWVVDRLFSSKDRSCASSWRFRAVRAANFTGPFVGLPGRWVFLGTLKGFLVAVILSLLGAGKQEVNPPVVRASDASSGTDVIPVSLRPRHPHDESWPGLFAPPRGGSPVFLPIAHGVLSRMRAEVNQHQPTGGGARCSCR